MGVEEVLLKDYEEFFCKCFKLFQLLGRYNDDKVGGFEQYYFMSERFYKLYKILLERHSELKLPKKVYSIRQNKPNKPTLYINDVVSDMPKKIGSRDKIQLVSGSSFFDITEIYPSNGILNSDEIVAPWISKKREIKTMKKDFKITKKNHKKINTFIERDTMRRKLDFLGCELQILKKYGVSNVYDLAPIYARKYFKLIFENRNSVQYYIHNFYNICYERDIHSDEQKKEIQIEVFNQIKKRFRECDSEFLYFFATIVPSYYYFLHYPLEYDFSNIDGKLSLIEEEKKLLKIKSHL